MSQGIFRRLKQFDAYPKTLEDFRIKTYGGATITLVSGAIMLLLFASELGYYLTTEVTPELFVDTTRGEKLRINLDVTMYHIPCSYLSIDAMDVSGEQQLDVAQNIVKQRLHRNGSIIEGSETVAVIGAKADNNTANTALQETVECGSCYGAETPELKCCNTCEEVREAYRRKGWAFNLPDGIVQCEKEGWTEKLRSQKDEGCRVNGYIEVSKVAGNFHFAPGKSFQQHHVHVHDLQPFGTSQFNTSHVIHRLSFGEDYPGILNPLDGYTEISLQESIMYQYFVKIVPTVYRPLSGELVKSNQFSVTKHQRRTNPAAGETGLPGVFILYDLSPLLVQLTEHRRSFAHFVTGICAIIGGVFTVAGMIDSMVYHSAKALQKKIELGKAS